MISQIPDFSDFHKLSYDHKDEIEYSLKKFHPEISEFSLGFLYGYRENFDFKITKILDNICIYGLIQQIPSFLPPIGNNDISKTITSCLEFLNKSHGSGRINAVSETTAKSLESCKNFKISLDKNNYDYIYKIQDLINLSGKKYESKRNFVLQFKKRYKYEYRKLTIDILTQCLDLQEKWCNLKNCILDESISMENKCVYELLHNFETLKLFGSAIYIDNKLQAFTIAETLNDNTAIIHTEKANTEYRGIYQAINNMFCKKDLSDFIFVNREQDMGVEGLRKAKLSYHPHHMVTKYNVELNK